jgi:hypothetical protein
MQMRLILVETKKVHSQALTSIKSAIIRQTRNQVSRKEGGEKMSEEVTTPTGRKNMVWVRDKAGNEYVCDLSALVDPNNLSEEEKKHCIDDASVPQAHAGG